MTSPQLVYWVWDKHYVVILGGIANQNIVLDNKMGFRTADAAIQDPPELESIQLSVLLEVTRSLNSTLDLNRLLEIIVEVAAALTDSEAASILLLDEVTGELRFEAATGLKKLK